MTRPSDPYRKWVRLLSIAVIAISFIPYIYGYLNTPPGMAYMGFADHPYDQNSYLSRIQQSMEGKFFILRDFTLEPQRPLFFNPFTWMLGRAAYYLALSPLAIYQVAHAVYAYLLLMGIYWFIGFFVRGGRQRFFAFALCAFSSGLCWTIPYHTWLYLFKRLNLVPICYWIAETIIFESILSFPQFVLTTLFMILGLGFFIRALRGPHLSSSLLGGLSIAVLAFLHPVDVVTVYAVLGVYCLVIMGGFWKESGPVLRSAFLIFLLSLPAMLYQYYLFSTEAVFIAWSKEEFISPNPLSYIIGYGLVLLLAIPEMVRVTRSRDKIGWFLFVWVAVVAVLLYAPLSFQRRLSLGVHIPLCILAAGTVFRTLLPWARRFLSSSYREAVILTIIFLITIPSNIVKIANCCYEQRTNPMEFYLPRADLEAMSWMRQTHNEDAPILSNYKSGLYLPAYTGNRVYVGHWSESVDFGRKAGVADWILFAPGRDDLKRSILKRNGIRYIYFGSFERMRAPFALEKAPYLDKIYDKGGVKIYRVSTGLTG